MSGDYGLGAGQWALVRRIAIEPLKKKGAQVWIFGSRATGSHRPFSDLDILYQMDPGKELSLWEIAEIRDALEESELTIKVNLVNQAELASSYRDEILRQRVAI